MPDLLVHVLVPWCVLSLLKHWRGWPEREKVALVLVGTILPDISAIGYLDFSLFQYHVSDLMLPFHTPAGVGLVAGILSLWFANPKQAWGWLMVGSLAHFVLDSLVMHAAGGMALLFPLVWVWGFQVGVLKSTDWDPFVITAIASLLVWLVIRRDNPSGKI
jgi:hypothetical protein